MYVCMYVCMYVGMYAFTCIHVFRGGAGLHAIDWHQVLLTNKRDASWDPKALPANGRTFVLSIEASMIEYHNLIGCRV